MKKMIALLALAVFVNPFLLRAQDHPQPHGAPAAPISAEALWKDLMDGNQRFMHGANHELDHVLQRERLAKGQQPKVAVLACADSRVAPEILFDKGLGELFVVRAAGNSADPLGIGSLEYAVEHLGTSVIVVLGHQSCGAVAAACSGGKMPSPNLEAVVRPILSSCPAAKTSAGNNLDLAVRDHARQTGADLLKQSELLRHAVAEGKLTIIDAYYQLESGKVERLPQ